LARARTRERGRLILVAAAGIAAGMVVGWILVILLIFN
jgi:hypothetical protein